MTDTPHMARLKYSQFAARIDVEQFEEAIDFEPLERSKSGEDRGYCPDVWGLHKHGDTTGKFSIHREKRVYHCWVCGGGTLLSLIMEMKQLDELAATDWLYQYSRPVEESSENFLSEIDELLAIHQRKDAVLPYFNFHVLDRWKKHEAEIREWSLFRHISPATAIEFHLGYDPEHRRSSSKGTYSGPAVILPHFWNDRLVGWQERWLDEERPKWVPKYTNTNDFPRRETIFNYERVYFSQKPIIVCESAPTVMVLASLGLPAMATFGSAVTPEQLALLRRCQQGIVLAPDDDEPGTKWRNAIVEYLDRYVRMTEIHRGGNNDGGDLADIAVWDGELVKDLYYHARTVL